MNAPTAPVLTPEIAWSFGSCDQRVILEDAFKAILGRVRDRRKHAGVYENPDQRRQFALGDEVIEDDGNANVVAERAAAIEKNHEGSGLCRIVLRGNVNSVIVRSARIEFARIELVLRDGSLRNSGLWLRIGTEHVRFSSRQRCGAE